MEKIKISFIIALFFLISCQSNKALQKSEPKPTPFKVSIRVKDGSASVNRVIAALYGVQKPNSYRISYPFTDPGSIQIDYGWKLMTIDKIKKIKKFCEELPDVVSLDYDWAAIHKDLIIS